VAWATLCVVYTGELVLKPRTELHPSDVLHTMADVNIMPVHDWREVDYVTESTSRRKRPVGLSSTASSTASISASSSSSARQRHCSIEPRTEHATDHGADFGWSSDAASVSNQAPVQCSVNGDARPKAKDGCGHHGGEAAAEPLAGRRGSLSGRDSHSGSRRHLRATTSPMGCVVQRWPSAGTVAPRGTMSERLSSPGRLTGRHQERSRGHGHSSSSAGSSAGSRDATPTSSRLDRLSEDVATLKGTLARMEAQQLALLDEVRRTTGAQSSSTLHA
jgi:hypothetical protein